MAAEPPPAPTKEEDAAPENDEATAQPAGPAPAGGKGKKPKKKKRLSRKELARLAKERAEQERLEAERRAIELQEQKERDEQQRQREEQQQRLLEEDTDIKRLRQNRARLGRNIRTQEAQVKDWEIFTACNHSVDVRSESDVNTFLANWRDQEETELAALFEQIDQAHSIVDQLTAIKETAEVSQEQREFERCVAQIEQIKTVIFAKIEALTMHILVFSDKFVGAKNEVLLSASAGPISYGIWVNLTRSQRNQEIEWPNFKVLIPKEVTKASFAVTMTMIPETPYDPEYLLLGRLIRFDILQLPAPPKKIGTMTLRQPPTSTQLVKLTYPLKNISGAQPPLSMRLRLDPELMTDFNKEATIVTLGPQGVSQNHISKVAIDPEANEIRFSTSAVGFFAMAVPRYQQFPIRDWELTPQSPTSVEIYVEMANAVLEMTIDAGGKCSMRQPFTFTGLTPVSAVKYLAERGLNIIAPATIEGINPKTPELEDVLAQGIADIATGFVVTWSKWNALLAADRAMLLMRQMTNFNEPQEPEGPDGEPEEEEQVETAADAAAPPPPKKKKKTTLMKAILVKANHIVEVPNSEEKEESALKPIEGRQIHQHILPMFLDGAAKEVRDRVRTSPSFLCDATLYFMKSLRVFSMTK
jgi:cancer susceptibility candidate protein 1